METTIIISVLSTLGVVALVTAIVVAFVKLGKKVDNNNFDTQINDVYQTTENMRKELEGRISEVDTSIWNADDEMKRFVDSRCDKLDTKIQNLNKSSEGKQLLTD